MERNEMKSELENALNKIRDIYTDNEYIDKRLCEIEELIINLINKI